MPVGPGLNDPDVVSDSTRRVKVFDSRRKQRWVEPQARIPPTPPRSPTIPEPLLDDLLELWSGMDEPSCKQHDISLHSALSSLDFDDYQSHVEMGEDDHGDLEASAEDEDLLDHLLTYTFDDSPPPTNPASPREVSDQESDVTETIQMYPTLGRHDEDDTDMELEEFDRYPKTEPITSEFTSHIFDSLFTTMITEEDDSDSSSDDGSVSYGRSVSDGIEIKHDCMWAGSCQSETHQDLFEEFFGNVTVKHEYEEGTEYDITSNHDHEEDGLAEELDEESNLEVLRNTVMGDHSYAFHGCGPVQQHQCSQPIQQSCSAQTHHQHAIQGILLKDEQSESSPKKTKILVPLKDLMETLQQKSYLVAPLGPGKKVYRLTGSGDTVKGVLDLGAQFKSASVSTSSGSSSGSLSGSLSCSSSLSVGGGKGSLNKKPASKMKKAIHKPKQELSPSSPVTSSRTSPSHSSSSSNIINPSSSNGNSPLTTAGGKPRKAKTHNNMERMRRIDLRNSFDTLKRLVPMLNKANKCSKVEILKSATEYINALKVIEKKILREEYALKTRNENLRNRLSNLSSN